MIPELDTSDKRKKYKFGGMISHVEHKTTKAGKPFGVLHVEDFTGDTEALLWAESYIPARDAGILEPGTVIRFKSGVQVDDRTETVKLSFCSEVKEVKTTSKKLKGVELNLSVLRHSPTDLSQIKTILQRHPGNTEVFIRFNGSKGRSALVSVGAQYQVRNSEKLKGELAKWIDVT